MTDKRKNIEFIDETQERKELKRVGTLKGLLAGSLLTRERVVRQLPYILFLTLLAFIYIGNRYNAEKIVRENSKLQDEVRELRAKAISTSAELMHLSKQSEVIRLIRQKDLGLEESVTPPRKIVVDKED
ncbi:MAG TPA: FtsL-like putative cell division protein [Bacteroidales bacterium]|nr:FtsL-like putative cell division protein [Bacteroidales bacterium]